MAGKKYKLTFSLANGETQEIVFEVPPGETGPQGIQGEPGATPYIGENGNWWVGETDTGVRAIAPDDALSEAEVVALIDSKLSSITNAEEVAY